MKKLTWLMICFAAVNLIGPTYASVDDGYDVAAFYWPSLHYDQRWAEFFPDGSQGEWESIRNCKPKWEGHWQPRVPAWGYLMDNDPKAMEKKIDAATSHGVNVMIFDWYWFENKPFLESALNDGFLKAKNVDKMKFYLMWANHDAKTAWDIRRSHKMETIWPGSVDLPTFKTVVARVINKYFSHPSYYKIDGKPVFSIYDMNNLINGLGGVKQTVEALDYFRTEVKKAGFPDLHFQMIYWGRVPKIDDSGFASAKGTAANTIKTFKVDSLTNYQFVHLARPEADYIKWADKALSNWPKWSKDFDVPYFPHVSIGWDNNARFVGKRGAVTENVNPETFKKYLVKAKAYADAHPDQQKLITINAWNEWVEGSYLEPDKRFGMGYLKAVEDVFVSPDDSLKQDFVMPTSEYRAIPITGAKDLETAFSDPPESARPWVFWYWMQANATRDGITHDLEAMAETGVGGAILMPIGNAGSKTIAEPPANPLSEDFWKLVVHAAKEAERLGLGLEMNACDGWALAGGPWITPDMSMQEVVTTELIVDGGKEFKGKLAKPMSRSDYYRDIAVLAFPTVEGTGVTSTQLQPKATTNIKGLDPQVLVKGAGKLVRFSSWGWIQFEFAQPFTCRSITISPDIKTAYQCNRAEVLVSDDGKEFRSLGRLKSSQFHGWQDGGMSATYSIEKTTARFFRFVIDPSGTQPHSESHEGSKARHRMRMSAQHIELSSQPRINHWQGKAGYRWRRSEWTSEKQCPDDLCVPVEKVIDITDKMDVDGKLRWSVPNGKWTIQRIGYTTTGVLNRPGGTGVGLECDKFNPAAAKVQFDGWFGEALKRVGPKLAGKTLRRNHTDSWEAFSQNWSPVFRDEFIKRRGYDPIKWLPVMSGVPVGSAELSERFLYDIRRTINDLVCDNFFGSMVKFGREHGAGFSAECIAPTMMSDGLELFKYADIPMGEFWLNSVNQDKPNDIKDAISGGHIYGKRIIGAEAFTQNPLDWNEDPYYLKPLGDYNFAKGINKFVLHVWAHQAFDKKPGVTLNRIGTFFSGTQTWHKPGRAWFDYVRRCSSMLQQGLPVADVCYFIGEEQPSRSYLRDDLPVELPDGFAYDCINRDALLTRAMAKDGRIVLPDGTSYRLLVLPPSERMTPELAKKIGELAKAGVPVIGSRPNRSISLSDYPKCDEKVRRIVDRSWKSVRTNATTQAVLKELGLLPDVEFIGADMTPVYNEKMEYFSTPFAWTHRKTKDADIYFLSNQQRRSRNIDVAFRGNGRVPELWNPVTGRICDAGIWRIENGRTIVPVRFASAGSVFVVFRRKSSERVDPVAQALPLTDDANSGKSSFWIEDGRAWTMENGAWALTRQSGKVENLSIKDLPAAQVVSNSWTINFPAGCRAPKQMQMSELKSLSEHKESGVKYFSGTAEYNSTFTLAKMRKGDRLFLDLGRVANLAEVIINGKNLGVLWKPPFIVEVTDVVKPGENTLKIDVTNTWLNRLVGDASLPVKDRSTWLLFADVYPSAKTPLEPAGLIGPVMLKTARGVKIVDQTEREIKH